MSLADLFADFTNAGLYLRNWSPRTVRTYRQGFSSLQQSLQGHGPKQCSQEPTSGTPALLSKAQLEAWVIGLRQKGVSPGGCNMYIRTINSFLSWMHEEGHLPARLKLKLLPCAKTAPAPFADADIRMILAFRPTNFAEWRLWTLIQTHVDTGERIDEALTLRTINIRLSDTVFEVVGKGNKTRLVPFSHELRKVLFRYAQVKRKRGINEQWFFCTHQGQKLMYRNVHRDIVVLCTKLGIKGPRVSPHTFRHYFAVNFMRHGGDIYTLSRILGHEQVSTTAIYLRSMGIEQLTREHGQHSPLARLG